MEPQTEADQPALLLQFLAFFGAMCGRHAYVRVGRTRHYPNLFLIIVGGTGALGRKGISYDDVFAFYKEVDPIFCATRMQYGMSSGEGFVKPVADRVTRPDEKTGQLVIICEGTTDKRALWFEPEAVSMFATKGREGNTLSAHIRNAWDRGLLGVATKNSSMRATDAHIGIIGHITPVELEQSITETDAFNGFGNRFLWALAKRSQLLPFGGDLVPLPTVVDRVRLAVTFAADHVTEIGWSESAKNFWKALYPALSPTHDGVASALLARAEPQIVRIALNFALLDLSPVIDLSHIRAAQAVWKYCRESVQVLFGDDMSIVDPFNRILYDLIESRPGINFRRLDVEMHYPPRMKLVSGLRQLEEEGLITRARERRGPQGGRPAECFYPETPKLPNQLVTDGGFGDTGDAIPVTQTSSGGTRPNRVSEFGTRIERPVPDYDSMSREELLRSVDKVLVEGIEGPPAELRDDD
jgi:hypothetical protein